MGVYWKGVATAKDGCWDGGTGANALRIPLWGCTDTGHEHAKYQAVRVAKLDALHGQGATAVERPFKHPDDLHAVETLPNGTEVYGRRTHKAGSYGAGACGILCLAPGAVSPPLKMRRK